MDDKNQLFFTEEDIRGIERLAAEELFLFPFVSLFPLSDLSSKVAGMETFEELLERDKMREKDGFPKKIKIRQVAARSSGKISLVPVVEEEKLVHIDPRAREENGGQGEGEEGDVIGEQQIEDEGGDSQPGGPDGESEHGVEAEVLDIANKIIEDLELPNLKEKAKKVATDKYIFDLTSRNSGSGQVLDKKATLKEIVKTNLALETLDPDDPDTSNLIIPPYDKIYRVFSRERVWESMAVVVFLRDYSGSMWGKKTELVVTQHLAIYGWLMREYADSVIAIFILHDNTAKRASGFNEYFSASINGGTVIATAYQLVNKIVEDEGFERDYNIYVFHGTDGDDWDTKGEASVPAIKKCLTYVNRLGITIVGREGTVFEKVIKDAKFITESPKEFRMDVLPEDSDQKKIGEGIRKLVSL